MKKMLAMLLVLVMMMATGAVAFADTEVIVWSAPINTVNYFEALYAMIDRFNAENPDIEITVEELNYDGIAEKLESAMMTSSTPDIYIDGTARTAKLPSTGLTVPVDDVINALDGWNEGALNIGKVEDSYYLVPMTLMPSTVLGVNMTLAKKYGVDHMLPEDHISWDWDQFMAFLEACGEKSLADGVYPTALYSANQSSDIAYYTALLSAGVDILNADHTAAAVNTEAAATVLRNLKTIADKGLAYPGTAEMTDDDGIRVFFSGLTVVDWVNNGALSVLPNLQVMKDEGTIAEIPEVSSYAMPTLNGSKTNIANWGANCIAVFENEGDEEKIAAAKKFLTFMMNDKEYVEALWLAAPAYGPSREMGAELKIEDAELLKQANIYTAFAPYNNSEFGILESYWGEIRQQFYPNLQSMFLGNKTPEEVVAAFEAGINDVLESNK